jgi:hypothetical protein
MMELPSSFIVGLSAKNWKSSSVCEDSPVNHLSSWLKLGLRMQQEMTRGAFGKERQSSWLTIYGMMRIVFSYYSRGRSLFRKESQPAP